MSHDDNMSLVADAEAGFTKLDDLLADLQARTSNSRTIAALQEARNGLIDIVADEIAPLRRALAEEGDDDNGAADERAAYRGASGVRFGG